MSTTSTRTITITETGTVTATDLFSAASNATAPAATTVQDLASGANTITVPTPTGVTITGVTFVPPSGNTQTILLKGVSGDTGFSLHKTDPSSLGINTAVTTSFVLTASGSISNFIIKWS